MGGTEQTAAGQAGTPPAITPAELRELYTGPPAEFVARRKSLVAAVRARGDKEAARSAAALRKPTTPAWVLNLLADDGRTAPELLELAGAIAAAVTGGKRAELHTLAAAQRILVIDVLERATGLAAAAGTAVPSAAREVVEGAVRGVLTDPSTAEQLFTGVLVDLPDPDDADALPTLAFRPHPEQQRATSTAPGSEASAAPPKRSAKSPSRTSPDPARTGGAAADRRRHLRAVREAGVALRAAERARTRRAETVHALEDERERLSRDLETLQERLTRARDELRAADEEVSRARSDAGRIDGSADG